jgi:hypothetical protein
MQMIASLSVLPNLPVRTLHLAKDPAGRVPEGAYDLIECFCPEIDCDCRRVMIAVMSQATEQPLAFINYGWESLEFYRKWAGDEDDAIDCMHPYLDPLNPQSDSAPVFLALFKEYVIQDKAYMERIKQHYLLFKAELKRRSRPFTLVKPKQRKPKPKHRRK